MGCPAVNFWNLYWVVFALDCPFQGKKKDCTWSLLQEIFSCRSVWQIFMSQQCSHYLHALGCPAVNFLNLELVVFALDCPVQRNKNYCAWSLLQEILTKQQNFLW
jgi:hypothetical protein